jgi:hypothetical protein
MSCELLKYSLLKNLIISCTGDVVSRHCVRVVRAILPLTSMD